MTVHGQEEVLSNMQHGDEVLIKSLVDSRESRDNTKESLRTLVIIQSRKLSYVSRIYLFIFYFGALLDVQHLYKNIHAQLLEDQRL